MTKTTEFVIRSERDTRRSFGRRAGPSRPSPTPLYAAARSELRRCLLLLYGELERLAEAGRLKRLSPTRYARLVPLSDLPEAVIQWVARIDGAVLHFPRQPRRR
jgi:hypothetical protein